MGGRLDDAMSPYLRAHAQNPVDWYPWGEAAFDEARARDVPVLISIGYATCHWCHVMARESFSDPALARALNERYVAIKVDREEHPDVDSTYMAAASAFTRELGWPLTVFATPEGRAFYAGTYFPPEPARGMPSFRQVLAAVDEAWRERRSEIVQTAAAVAEALAETSAARTAGDLPSADALRQAIAQLADDEDRVHGGFGGAPKFPVGPVVRFLAASPGEGRALALRTMRLMGASALRDPVEGGFFRYATRADWTEPHYERMLTDNAQLLSASAELARSHPDEVAPEAIARGIIRFLTEAMQLAGGGFASAQDSESVIDGVRNEGGYYRADAEARRSLAPPLLDEKVLTGWNGLAISALARASVILDDAAARAAAVRAARFLLERHVLPDRLVRASRDGQISSSHATLEDTGMLANGLLELALATGDAEYAVTARSLIDAALAAAEGSAAAVGADSVGTPSPAPLPFRAPDGADPVLADRGLAVDDDPGEGAMPSGVSACAHAAWTLWLLGAGDRYRAAAEAAMKRVAGAALARPIAFGSTLRLMARFVAPVVQLVTVVPDGVRATDAGEPMTAEPATDGLVRATRAHEASVATIVTESQARAFSAAGFELFDARGLVQGRAAAYRCREFVCAMPVGDADALGAIATAPDGETASD
ncbi:thioredoxin domain-containing protein [Agromyces neolithicus]|uniref:Thioredoxin domain-containing protein n=1 Tax=Agromyces neolithicus TaxID=269420 RepID=A0ABP4YK12_9MICO